jgi:single-stranded-DNA-specific exonuclease
MEKQWVLPRKLCDDELKLVQALATPMKCPLQIAELLYRKGLHNMDEIEDFFNPRMDKLYDPYLFEAMELSVNRIVKALNDNEQITIYGDYDVDGTTATALLYLGLKRIGALIDFYIPHRMIDGYGLSLNSLDYLKDNGSSLIISVDCGVNAQEEIEAINAMGMEIIITDHHNPKDDLPPAYAIINPKLSSCDYPYPDLAGVGVAYKLLCAIYKKMGLDTEENLLKYMDLVAVGTIADIVPLTGETGFLPISD